MYEKAKCVCFIYMQMQKLKFTFVQINMKQVLYVPIYLSHDLTSPSGFKTSLKIGDKNTEASNSDQILYFLLIRCIAVRQYCYISMILSGIT